MLELYEQIRRTAPTEARVLILGENGTGKELVARALHRHSPRARGPFVRVNCAAVPGELFESELFGHERGAFTGATARRRGKLVRAHRGTLFLDEIAEIPPALQAKLLRALESGEVEPVGAERELTVDVRFIAATNKDLARAVAAHEFREDLYYRLQVVTLRAPALRERLSDLPALARRFLRAACAENHTTKVLTEAALARLARHDWPGNVRELRNLVERLVILTPHEALDAEDVARALPAEARAAAPAAGRLPVGATLRDTMERLEREVLRQVLEEEGWRMTAAAERLGLERSHLYKKMRALGLSRP
jgi:DNA-binding NtrC family response regulator